MCEAPLLRVAGFTNDSVVDGPGLRFTVYVQGCPHACPGCHNPETWPFEGGQELSAAEIFGRIRKNPLLSGVTFSGGEPFCQAAALLPLARLVRGAGLELAVYTGFLFEELLALPDPAVRELVSLADHVVDGPFVLAQRDLSQKFKGSRNQRVLDAAASLAAGRGVEDASPRWN